jgi:hypothetical protein
MIVEASDVMEFTFGFCDYARLLGTTILENDDPVSFALRGTQLSSDNPSGYPLNLRDDSKDTYSNVLRDAICNRQVLDLRSFQKKLDLF